jgi:hypothetical protein
MRSSVAPCKIKEEKGKSKQANQHCSPFGFFQGAD